MRSRLYALSVLSLCGVVTGCGSSTNSGSSGVPSAGAGGSAAAAQGGSSVAGVAGSENTAGSITTGGGGTSGGGTSGGGTSSSESGTAGVSGGSAGTSAAGSAGASGSAAGAAGSAGTGCVQAGSPGKTGTQCDPGKDGDGVSMQVDPMGNGTPTEGVGTAKGMVLPADTYPSKIFNDNFVYQIFVPVQYKAGTPAALMIFQDGGNYLATFHTPKIFETLIDAKAMPVTIAIFINPGVDRSKDYDSINDNYVRFLTEELIPDRIATKYTIVDDPNGWAIGGHSSGGSASFTAGWNKPDKFRKILTNSGSFVNLQGDMSAGTYPMLVAAQSPAKPLRVAMSSADNDLPGWRTANDTMAAALDKAGYAYHYVKNGGMHDPTPYDSADYANVLRWLWRGYTIP